MRAISKSLKKSLDKQSEQLPPRIKPSNGNQVQTPMRHPSELPPAVRVK